MKKVKAPASNAALAMPTQTKESKDREQRYQGEDDLRTLTRAEEIRGDKGRLSNVRGVHRDQLSALQRMGRAMGGDKDRDDVKGRSRRGRRRSGSRR